MAFSIKLLNTDSICPMAGTIHRPIVVGLISIPETFNPRLTAGYHTGGGANITALIPSRSTDAESRHLRKDTPLKYLFYTIMGMFFIVLGRTYSQHDSFSVKAKGVQVFNTHDSVGRNQVTFHSKAPLEDIFGAAADVSGKVSFDASDVHGTMKGFIIVQVKSMRTGLKKRDTDMLGEQWLDVGRYPTITFKVKRVEQTKSKGNNELSCMILGDFTMHGVTRTITIPASLKYLEENQETRTRAPGDLLVLKSAFSVRFEDHGIRPPGNFVGIRVAKSIDLDVSIIATNHVYSIVDN
jgi:polyisoprenoid-binding protein YceI